MMLIGELSRRSGFSRDTIRYYDKLGLLPAVEHIAANGYHLFGQSALLRLRQIGRLKQLGFALREIKELFASAALGSVCEGLPSRLRLKLQLIDAQMASLSSHRESLLEMQQGCNGRCASRDGIPDCVPVQGAMAPVKVCC